MTIRLSACAFAAAVFVGLTATNADAQCTMNDFACRKFNGNSAPKKVSKRRRKATYRNRRKSSRRTASTNKTAPTTAAAVASVTSIAPSEPTSASVATSLPRVSLTKLQPGTISEAPKNLSSLVFESGDQIEVATAQCSPVERSNRRISCAVAVHRLAITSEAGAGCVGSLGLRQVEFAKNDQGDWVNEDSIALCGGRLLRRAELFPVSVNGSPRYALREEYQMLGGDRTCAAPYLRSRHPLRKSYMPTGNRGTRSLRCGTVASR